MIPSKEQLRREKAVLDQLELGQITAAEAAERLTVVYRDRYEAHSALRAANDHRRG